MNDIINIENPFKQADVFSDGVYARTLFMPKGSLVIGKLHKTRHLNFIIKGKAWVWLNGIKQYIEAPMMLESLENTRKCLIIEEDMVWTTVHATDKKDTDSIEEDIIQETSMEDIMLEIEKYKDKIEYKEIQWLG